MANVLKSGKWSKDYPRCQNCGTTSIEHKAEGLCNRCYLWAYRQAGGIKKAVGKKKRKDTGKTKK